MQSVIIGTAQWGLDYGVTNRLGRLPDEAVLGIAERARDVGVTRLDTAPAYGDAEFRIGHLLSGFDVQTKVSAAGGAAVMLDSISDSLRALRVTVLSGVLVHDWPSLTSKEQRIAAQALEEARKSGLVDRVGASGYDEADVASALNAFAQVDVIQVPGSVLDQRLAGSPVLARARGQGVAVQARSIFLQGVALDEAGSSRFGQHPDVIRLRDAAQRHEVSLVDLCLGFVKSSAWIDEVVLAATTVEEFDAIWSAWQQPQVDRDWSAFASTDQALVDPRQWPA